MPTVIQNEPAAPVDTSGGMGNAFAIILLVIVVFLLLFYGLPALRGGGGGNSTPAPDESTTIQEGTDINVPDQIDVNINQEEAQSQ